MFKFADSCFFCISESSGLMSEEFAFYEILGNSPTVYSDEIFGSPLTVFMQGTGYQLFSGAGFPHDQDIGPGVGNPGNGGSQLYHCRCPADNPWPRRTVSLQFLTQDTVFQGQGPFFQGPLNRLHKAFSRIRFLYEIIGSVTHRLDGCRDISMSGNEDDRQIMIYLLGLQEKFQAAHAGQTDITDHHPRPFHGEMRHCIFRTVITDNIQIRQFQRLFVGLADMYLIVDEHYFFPGFHSAKLCFL